MIGEKIRRLRIQRGLSQNQLAGKEMTRAFISQIENGHCTPSPLTLQILADRLGKPLSFFLEETQSEAFGVKFLWESAVADTQAGQWEAALPKLAEALRLIRQVEDENREADIQFFYALSLYHLRRPEEALEQFEEVQERFKALGRTTEALRTWLTMGHCYTRLEQYSTARRFYQKVIRHGSGIKSAQELHLSALCNLATVHMRTGETDLALQTYREALSVADPDFMPELWGQVAIGLGAAYRRVGRPQEAAEWSRKALDRLLTIKSHDALLAEHNLALALMDQERWEQAYTLLQRTLSRYREHQDYQSTVEQASIMEDISRYWLHRGNLDQAEAVCWQAIDLLADSENARLRGLLYRQLSHIYELRGNGERVRELLQLSQELFRRAQATNLLRETEETMRRAGER